MLNKVIILLLLAITPAATAVEQKDARREIVLYKWYIEHYTGFTADDIAMMKAEWDAHPELAMDPNIRINPRSKRE